MSETKPLPELLLWKLRAHYYEAELALERARSAMQKRDQVVSEARAEITRGLPEGFVVLEIDMESGVFRFGQLLCESASIAPPTMGEVTDGRPS